MKDNVVPVLGNRPLQQLKAPEIDKLYAAIADAGKIAPRPAHHVHIVFGALPATAARKGLVSANPMARVERVPNPDAQVSGEIVDEADDDIGEGLDEAELATLVAGFRPSTLFPVVALATASGARRNEQLALRWSDLGTEGKTLRIERAWEQTNKFGLRLKPPKNQTRTADDLARRLHHQDVARRTREAAHPCGHSRRGRRRPQPDPPARWVLDVSGYSGQRQGVRRHGTTQPAQLLKGVRAARQPARLRPWGQVGAKQGIVHRSFLIFCPLSD
jgi:hypothetical protein